MSTGESLNNSIETTDPDARLMLQVRDDVQGAFEVLVEKYQNRLLGILAHQATLSGKTLDITKAILE